MPSKTSPSIARAARAAALLAALCAAPAARAAALRVIPDHAIPAVPARAAALRAVAVRWSGAGWSGSPIRGYTGGTFHWAGPIRRHTLTPAPAPAPPAAVAAGVTGVVTGSAVGESSAAGAGGAGAFAALSGAAAGAAPLAAAGQPISARISAVDGPGGPVPRFGRFEATFQVAAPFETLPAGQPAPRGLTPLAGRAGEYAPNLQLPFRPAPPAYVANLYQSEDARLGVSVDGLMLPPGQTDWSQAESQPAFWFEGYDQDQVPTGEKDWHLRFSPDAAGVWQYRIKVTDSQGVGYSAPQSFTVTPSAAHGFVAVSAADTRYFQFSDGTPFLPAGAGGGLATVQKMQADGATGWTRFWVNTLGITGGDSGNLTSGDGYAGTRFDLFSTPAGDPGDFYASGVTTGRAYTFRCWVRLTDVPASFAGAPYLSFNEYTGPSFKFPLAANDSWQQVTIPITAASSWGNHHDYQIHIECLDSSNAAHTLSSHLSSYGLYDDLTGESVGGDHGNWLTHWNQQQSAQLDALVTAAETGPVTEYLKLNCFNHSDDAACEVNPDGTNCGYNANNFYGGSNSPTAGTFQQLTQGYFARYFMARWGYSPSVAAEEYNNEGAPYNGNHYAGADAFAAACHAYAADHRVLGTTSCWWVGARTYDPGLYQNPALPDIDFADMHLYPTAGQGAYDLGGLADYNVRGDQVIPTGGPGGLGMLEIGLPLPRDSDPAALSASGDSAVSDGQIDAVIPQPSPIQGRGVWTVRFWYRFSPDAAFGPGGENFNVTVDGDSAVFGPGGYATCPYPTITAAPTTWTQGSGTFTVPDGAPHLLSNININAGGLIAGHAYVSDIRLIAPDGTVWQRYDFNEPSPSDDYTAYTQYVLAALQNYSGGPRVGKPVVDGESEVYGTQSFAGYGAGSAQTSDPDANMAREAAWGLLAPTASIVQYWQEATQHMSDTDGWRYWACVQKFIAGVPLTDGQWRNAMATASTPALVATVSQEDTLGSNRAAYAYVYNRAATWAPLGAGVPVAPASGSVTFPLLPDGAYTVERWDPGTGQRLSVETDAASGGAGLTVPIPPLAQDVALKVYPPGQAATMNP